jgi:hypothetical protein
VVSYSELSACTYSDLKAAIECSWIPATAFELGGEGEAMSPVGQCAVTALVVQDAYGGRLLRGEVEGRSHYWNLLQNGRSVDLTRDQFGCFKPLNIRIATREVILEGSNTIQRYRLLGERVGARLAGGLWL